MDKVLLWFCFILCPVVAQAQTLIRGLVVDSLTIESLPGVTVQLKNVARGSTTSSHGIFVIEAMPGDTLIFSSVGYMRKEMPAFLADELMLVRLKEVTVLLPEIVIRAQPLTFLPEKIHSHTLSTTRPLAMGPLALDYFGRWER